VTGNIISGLEYEGLYGVFLPVCIRNIIIFKEENIMYKLYQHVEDDKQLYLGDYKSLEACERSTEVMFELLDKRGIDRAAFHCESSETHEVCATWHYMGGLEKWDR
jgi:hypothetical protein